MDRIAVGGMAEVFKGKMFGVQSFERTVALKRILPNIAEDQEFITMFIDEAKIAVQLSHPNIAQIFELGEVDHTYFIAMEYVQGRDLRTIFDRAKRQKGPPVTPQMAAYVMAKACEGLDYAHRKRDNNDQPLHIVHRDVSPQNVLVSYDGDVKIIDFGVAKAQSKSTRTQAGILKGKFGYMSPEQVQGFPLDQRSDVFSIGIVLHEILTGQRLFVGESDFHTLEKIRKAEAVPPSRINPHVPQQLDAIVMKALARDLHIRYQYASEMQEDLQRFLYTMNPVYSRRDLSTYMQHAFEADIAREKQRTTEYDHFFAAMQPGASPQQAVQTPTGSWNHQPAESFSSSGSFSGSHPAGYAGGPYSGSIAAPAPAYASPQTSFVGQQPQTPYAPQGYAPSDDDPTSFDPHALSQRNASLAGPPVASPFSPPPNKQYLTGDSFQGPHPAPPRSSGGGEDEGSPTIIDMDFNTDLEAQKQTSTKRSWMLMIFSALLVCGVGAAALYYLFFSKLQSDPLPKEPARITLSFSEDIQNTRFFLNNQEIPANLLKSVGPRSIMIEIDKPGKGTLKVTRPDHKSFERHFDISPGAELTQPLTLKPLWAFVEIESEPPQATVLLNGNPLPQPTPAKYRVRAEEKQHIEVVKQGHTVWKETLTLQGKASVKRLAKLKRTTASLSISCKNNKENAGAKVFLDKRLRGKIRDNTPVLIKKLNPTRSYKLKVVPNDYDKTFEQIITFPLHPDLQIQVDCVKPPPAPAQGAFLIKSSPSANVHINGKSYGLTPKQVTLPPGNYNVVLVSPDNKKRIGPFTYTIVPGRLTTIGFVDRNWN